jgi:hypothetical protein
MSIAAIVEKEEWSYYMMYMCEENYGQLTPNHRFPTSWAMMLFISREDEDEGVSQAPSEVSAKGVEALLTTMDH